METVMQTVRAVDANRHFSDVLKQVSRGEEFLVISRGKPVATIAPVKKTDSSHCAARNLLLDRLAGQEPTGMRSWTRDELYEHTR
jgi:prevent-host-death family protein